MYSNITPLQIKKNFLFFLIIAIFIFCLYAPALFHAPRADHWDYLLDMQHCQTCSDTLLHSYSYNRTRTIAPGDTLLFRPLLFTYLALIDCTIRNHFMLIQSFGILLQLAVCWLFYKLLIDFGDFFTNFPKNRLPFFAFLATLIFASSPLIVEQVSWNHIQGYMISTLIGLMICRFLLNYLHTETLPLKKGIIGWLLCTTACFFYEANILFAWMLSFIFFTTKNPLPYKKSIALGFFLIPFIYFSVDYYDYITHQATFMPDLTSTRLIHKFTFSDTFYNAFRFLKYTFAFPLIAIQPHYGIAPRLEIPEASLSMLSATGLITTGVLVFTVLLLFFTIRQQKTKKQSNSTLFILFLLGWLSAYTFINVLGRMNGNTAASALAASPYYAYVPSLIACLLFSIVGFQRYPTQYTFSKVSLIFFAILFFLFITVRGATVFRINQKQAKAQKNLIALLQDIHTHPNQLITNERLYAAGVAHDIPKIKILLKTV